MNLSSCSLHTAAMMCIATKDLDVVLVKVNVTRIR